MGPEGLPCCLYPARKGTLSRSALLVLLAGGFMSFSRELGSPEMVIIGRSITGLHSGRCCRAVHGPFLMALSPTAHSQGARVMVMVIPHGHRLCDGGLHGAERATSLAMHPRCGWCWAWEEMH